MKNYKWAWVYGLLTILLLYMMEQEWLFGYLTKTLIKLPLFTIIPYFLMRVLVRDMPKDHFKVDALKTLAMGIVIVIGGLILGYLLASPWIEIEAIRQDIMSRMSISKELLIGVALYTTFVNAFVEEYFFRKFLFRGSLLSERKHTAYILSSLLFSLYHMTIFIQWFTLPILLLALVGLFVGGLIFAWFADKSESIIGSWLVHVAADGAIMIIGIVIIGL